MEQKIGWGGEERIVEDGEERRVEGGGERILSLTTVNHPTVHELTKNKTVQLLSADMFVFH